MPSIRFFIFPLAIFVITSCSNTPRVAASHYFRYFNFNEVKNYTFYGRNSADFDYQSIADVMRNSIEFSIEKELDKKNLSLQSIKNADIIVSYFWVPLTPEKPKAVKQPHRRMNGHSKEKFEQQTRFEALDNSTQLKKYNRGVNYCRACLKMSNDGRDNIKIDTQPGALIIDLIDPKTQRSVWRSSYPVVIKEKENSQKMQIKIQRAINQMINQYPV